MNYIREINAFYDWIETNPLPAPAISLWHALMHIDNKTGWQPAFTVAIHTLSTKTGLKKDAILAARTRLQEVGRIGCESRPGQQSAVYHIIPFESVKPPQTATQTPAQTDCVGLTDASTVSNPAQTATQTPSTRPTQPDSTGFESVKPTQGATQTPSINKLNETNDIAIITEGESNGERAFVRIQNAYCDLHAVGSWQLNSTDVMSIQKIAGQVPPDFAVNVMSQIFAEKKRREEGDGRPFKPPSAFRYYEGGIIEAYQTEQTRRKPIHAEYGRGDPGGRREYDELSL